MKDLPAGGNSLKRATVHVSTPPLRRPWLPLHTQHATDKLQPAGGHSDEELLKRLQASSNEAEVAVVTKRLTEYRKLGVNSRLGLRDTANLKHPSSDLLVVHSRCMLPA